MNDQAIDLRFIAEQNRRLLDEMRLLRRDVDQIRSVTLAEHDFVRRLDRRYGELKDDLELIVKMEVSGALTALRTELDHRFADMEAAGPDGRRDGDGV